MGDFYLPPLIGRDIEKREAKKPRKPTKREKAKARAATRKAMKTDKPSAPRRMTCYSATCVECGRVWLSAIRPISNNTDNGYVCSGGCKRR